ncbi:MAG: heme ABC exporter ATP-binding protein CcmA [Gemmatimonadota bacterium]
MTAAIELGDLHRRFGRKRVLRGIDLTVARGSCLVLTGDNGAGKTTLLRILATLLRPSKGRVTIDGLSVAEDADRIRGRLAYVSARGFVYDDLTAVENLRFGARLAGVAITDEALKRILRTAGLGDATDQPVRSFSTGMRRRLALSALELRPLDLALIDEPYAGLDGDGTALVDRIVSDLLRAGTTVVLASHQAGEATRRADRTVRVVDGRLREVA